MAEAEKARIKLAKQDRKEANELLVAVGKEDVARVRLLLGIGYNPDAMESASRSSGVKGMEDGQSALRLALRRGNLVIARLLLVAGATVDRAMGEHGVTALMVAAGSNWLDSVQLLFEFSANPNVVDKLGSTALHYVAGKGKGHAAMSRLLVDHGALLNVQTDGGETALHLAAAEGKIEVVRILLNADAAVDPENKGGYTPAKNALLNKRVATLELLLRYGASAHRAAVLPGEGLDFVWTKDEQKCADAINTALEDQPSMVHLLADHGGICEKTSLDSTVSLLGHTQALRALRQVGCDMWCGGGSGINHLRKSHSISGTQLLGAELVGHTLQVRLRPSHLAAPDAPLDLVIGTRVVLHSLTSAAMNGEHGIVAGALGAQKEGRYSVRLRGRAAGVQIKASNLRVLVDPGRAAVAGHEVDALQSVVLGGATGRKVHCNGVYNLNPAHTANEFPVFTHTTDATQHLFCGDDGAWYVSDTTNMMAGKNAGWIASTSPSPSPLGLQWKVSGDTKWDLDPAVTLATPTWLTGSPPDDWILRDARVESYNEESHEHKLIFTNLARTSLHLRLDHHQFLDWDVLPRRRAAMLAPRTVVTALMILNRMEDGRVSKEKVLPSGTRGPVLRVFFAILMRSTKDFPTIFRDQGPQGPRGVWPCVRAPPNLILRGRAEDARGVRAAEATAAAAAARRSGGGGGRSGKKRGGKKKKKKTKTKKKKGRRKR